MLGEVDSNGETTPDFFERLNLRLAQSVTARNALGRDAEDSSREIATMVYGQVGPDGLFRFVNFGHPPQLVFSAEYGRFMNIERSCVAHFPALGLEVPEDHPDRRKYFSIDLRTGQMNSSELRLPAHLAPRFCHTAPRIGIAQPRGEKCSTAHPQCGSPSHRAER